MNVVAKMNPYLMGNKSKLQAKPPGMKQQSMQCTMYYVVYFLLSELTSFTYPFAIDRKLHAVGSVAFFTGTFACSLLEWYTQCLGVTVATVSTRGLSK